MTSTILTSMQMPPKNMEQQFSVKFLFLILMLILGQVSLGTPRAFATSYKDDKPWEVRGPKGEMAVSDVFYAEDVQNEQIVPTEIFLRKTGDSAARVKYQISHLIYPTIGNPKLLVLSDEEDYFLSVLRIERTLAARIIQSEKAGGDKASIRLRLFLLPKERRDLTESASPMAEAAQSFEVPISLLEEKVISNVPEELAARSTLLVRAESQAMAHFKDGLYDLRLEVTGEGQTPVIEFQYNAVRVFTKGPEETQNEYTILNFTDTQASVSLTKSKLVSSLTKNGNFKMLTHDRFQTLVKFLNTTSEPKVRNAAFITFNGDLHNGGAPLTLTVQDVVETYTQESVAILEILRELTIPIFLTAGNHDGYASIGQVPRLPKALKSRTLEEEVSKYVSREFWSNYKNFLEDTKSTPGGRHLDIFTGKYNRYFQMKDMNEWVRVPEEKLNIMLYDGFNQWRKTYGPLFGSWTFGKNHFINVNSYDLRQHRRTGWGMYTVNYGGGISSFQMDWISREIHKGKDLGRDIVVISHHDPRGGHHGKDYPYYFKQLDYEGMADSVFNYVGGEILNPLLCKAVPRWAQSNEAGLSCLHDGLQEWMRPDPEFDCNRRDLDDTITDVNSPDFGKCSYVYKVKDESSAKEAVRRRKRPVYSGYQFIKLLVNTNQIRTLLLGHTHSNSIEIFQPGAALIPDRVQLDFKSTEKAVARIGAMNPNRIESSIRDQLCDKENSWEHKNCKTRLPMGRDELESLKKSCSLAPPNDSMTCKRYRDEKKFAESYVDVALNQEGIKKDDQGFYEMFLAESGYNVARTLRDHELAIIRLTTAVDLTTQLTADNVLNFGFTALDIFSKTDNRNYQIPQVNRLHFFQKTPFDLDNYRNLGATELVRTESWSSVGFRDFSYSSGNNEFKNPFQGLFK